MRGNSKGTGLQMRCNLGVATASIHERWQDQCEAARYVNKIHVYKEVAQNETCGTSAAQEMTPVNTQSSVKNVFAHKCETFASNA